MDFFDILNSIMDQSDCDYASITVTKNGKTLTSTMVKMILTKIDKEIFADDVLKIMQDARNEIDDASSEHRKTCAKLTAYEEIEELLKT